MGLVETLTPGVAQAVCDVAVKAEIDVFTLKTGVVIDGVAVKPVVLIVKPHFGLKIHERVGCRLFSARESGCGKAENQKCFSHGCV